MSSTTAFMAPRKSPVMAPKYGHYHSMMYHYKLWSCLLVAIVVFVAILLIARERHYFVHSWAHVPVWISNPGVMSVFLLVSLLLAGWATCVAFHYGGMPWHLSAMGLFLTVGILLAVVSYLVYRVHNFVGAFWLNVVVLVLLVGHFVAIWNVDQRAALANLPLVLFVVVSTYYLWFMADVTMDSGMLCTETLKATP